MFGDGKGLSTYDFAYASSWIQLNCGARTHLESEWRCAGCLTEGDTAPERPFNTTACPAGTQEPCLQTGHAPLWLLRVMQPPAPPMQRFRISTHGHQRAIKIHARRYQPFHVQVAVRGSTHSGLRQAYSLIPQTFLAMAIQSTIELIPVRRYAHSILSF